MPTSATNTYNANEIIPWDTGIPHRRIPVKLLASTTFLKGTVLGEVSATPGLFRPYLSGAADGSQIPKAILQYDCITDASNNVTFGSATGGGLFGETYKTAPAYVSGAFKTAELTGFDANAATVLGGHYLYGVVTDGVYAF